MLSAAPPAAVRTNNRLPDACLALAGKYVVLFFYPLDFTFVCPTEITAFSDRLKEFKEINCEVCVRLCPSRSFLIMLFLSPRSCACI